MYYLECIAVYDGWPSILDSYRRLTAMQYWMTRSTSINQGTTVCLISENFVHCSSAPPLTFTGTESFPIQRHGYLLATLVFQ
ncbi:MAG: hypothetical protein V1767_04940 [Chloroflexota bacterium]